MEAGVPGFRPKWRQPKQEGRKGVTPVGFAAMMAAAKPIGQNGAKQCKAKARSTGERCKGLAVTGAECCRHHGGYAHAFRRARAAGKPILPAKSDSRAARAYYCSVAHDEEYSEITIDNKPEVKGEKFSLSARGRKIAAEATRRLNSKLLK